MSTSHCNKKSPHLPFQVKDEAGKKYGKLTVIRFLGIRGGARWLCQCECKRTSDVSGSNLREGAVKSCGKCPRKKGTLTHNLSKTPEYRVWQGIKVRCYRQNYGEYRLYGGRGIRMSKRWYNSVLAFYEDMGPRPSPKHTIERIDNNGHYCHENCKWATQKEQQRNRRNNVRITLDGITKCLAEWAEEYKLPSMRLYNRLFTLHWPLRKALTTPKMKNGSTFA